MMIAMTHSWKGLVLAILSLWGYVAHVSGAYTMVQDPDGKQGMVIWPNREIRYCYETEATKTKYNKDVLNAWQIWLTSGLNSAFKITEVDAETCVSDHLNTMLIWDTDTAGRPGSLATVPGFLGPKHTSRQSSGAYPRKNRPSMALTSRTDIGMLNTAFNYAHEWGHAWGLYHEHQNANFWAGIDGAKSGKVFGPGNKVTYGGASIDNWQCMNLKDYLSNGQPGGGLTVQIPGQYSTSQWSPCTSWTQALGNQFSANDYLPFPDNRATGSTGHKSKNVDWGSMMLYNSKAGGSGTATDADNDQRLPILLQADGTLIPFNYAPTLQDINALESLYGLAQTKKTLLQKNGGTTTSLFKSLFTKSKDDSSPSSCL